MEENEYVNQPKLLRRLNDYKWFKNKNPYVLFGISALIAMLLVVVTFLLYRELSETNLFNGNGQVTDQQFDLSEEEKEGILKSLSNNSGLSDISGDEKHKELNQLKEQSVGNIQLREFEKIDILNQLRQ